MRFKFMDTNVKYLSIFLLEVLISVVCYELFAAIEITHIKILVVFSFVVMICVSVCAYAMNKYKKLLSLLYLSAFLAWLCLCVKVFDDSISIYLNILTGILNVGFLCYCAIMAIIRKRIIDFQIIIRVFPLWYFPFLINLLI